MDNQTDNDSFSQLEKIRRDEINESLLVGKEEKLENIAIEYIETAKVFYTKLISMTEKGYETIRRCRRDGDCFYRAVSFCLVENIRKLCEEKKQKYLQSIKEKLNQSNYESFLIDDFYNVLSYSILSSDKEVLSILMIDAEKGNSLVMLMRMLTSMEIQKNWEKYRPFIEEETTSYGFCFKNIDPLGKEADHVQVAALSTCLSIGIEVVYAIPGDETVLIADETVTDSLSISLLYRPGHYDILYKNIYKL